MAFTFVQWIENNCHPSAIKSLIGEQNVWFSWISTLINEAPSKAITVECGLGETWKSLSFIVLSEEIQNLSLFHRPIFLAGSVVIELWF
jgi:hypothetical protein